MTENEARRVGVEALKALAHPLRVRLFSELTSFGPATASTLAARLGESSGSASYHLRQLEKHGFVREDESRGTARDRWWERVPGPVQIGDERADPGAREAGDLVAAEFTRLEDQRFAEFVRRRDDLPEAWTQAAQSGSASVQLTPEELAEIGDRIWALFAEARARPAREGARRVDLQFRGFPVALPHDPP